LRSSNTLQDSAEKHYLFGEVGRVLVQDEELGGQIFLQNIGLCVNKKLGHRYFMQVAELINKRL
jgi:hypothetical protein